ncbi:tyrosine-protein kinase Yes-like [Ciona intestinalis]
MSGLQKNNLEIQKEDITFGVKVGSGIFSNVKKGMGVGLNESKVSFYNNFHNFWHFQLNFQTLVLGTQCRTAGRLIALRFALNVIFEIIRLTIGEYNGMEVAIKQIKQESNGDDLVNEAEIMKMLNHDNVLKIIGMVMSQPVCLLVEFMIKGNLQEVLQMGKEKDFTMAELLDIGVQIASAMIHLEQRKIIPP